MAFNVSFIYRVIDKYSRPLDGITRKTSRLNTVVRNSGVAMGRAFRGGARGLDSLGKKLRGVPSLANAAGLAMVGMAGAVPVRKALDFEQAITSLDKVLSFPSLSARSDFIKGLKAMGPGLGMTSIEMANLAFEAAKLGFAQEDILGFTKKAAMAAAAFDGITTLEAGQLIGDLSVKMQLGADGVDVLLDSINRLADTTTASGGDILNITQRMSTKFSALKIPPELGAALSATAAQLEVRPDRAATGLRIFFNKLSEMGRDADLIADPLATIKDVLSDIQALPAGQQGAAITDMFGTESQAVVMGLVNNMALLEGNIATVNDETTRAGSMQAEFAKVMGTVAAKLDVVAAKFDQLLVTMGEKLLPVLGRMADAAGPVLEKMTAFVNKNPGIVKLAAGLALAAAAFVILAGVIGGALLIFTPVGLAISGIVVALGLIGTAVFKAWDDFKAFAAWLKDKFVGVIDAIVDKFSGLGNLISSGLDLIGLGGPGEATITDRPVTPRDINADQARNRDANLNGRIGIDVTGPGRVSDAVLQSTAPGNLGFNVAGAAAN